jgi:glycosyltransferase involved in cell wall biosynthesis
VTESAGGPRADVDVVLPALDEAAAMPELLNRFPPGYRAIVVDNGSTDATAEVAAQYGALVVAQPMRGFGSACYAGLLAATASVVCFMDADGSFDPAELPLVAGPVVADAADLVLGARQPLRGAWPLHARVANRVLAAELRRRTGVGLTDLGPMRAAPRLALLELGLIDRRSGWPLEMVLLAARAGWRIAEVPVSYGPRVGRSKITGTLRGTVHAVNDMSRVLAR